MSPPPHGCALHGINFSLRVLSSNGDVSHLVLHQLQVFRFNNEIVRVGQEVEAIVKSTLFFWVSEVIIVGV